MGSRIIEERYLDLWDMDGVQFVVKVLKSSTVELLISDPHGAELRLEHKQVDSQRSKKTHFKNNKIFH